MQRGATKVLVTAWCLLAFVAPGFEHSVADTTALGLGLVAPGATPGLGPAVYDLLAASIGNVIEGGLFVAGAYLLAAQPKAAKPAQSNDCVPGTPGAAAVPAAPARQARLRQAGPA